MVTGRLLTKAGFLMINYFLFTHYSVISPVSWSVESPLGDISPLVQLLPERCSRSMTQEKKEFQQQESAWLDYIIIDLYLPRWNCPETETEMSHRRLQILLATIRVYKIKDHKYLYFRSLSLVSRSPGQLIVNP